MNSHVSILQNTHVSSSVFSQHKELWKNRALGAICFADLPEGESSAGMADIPFIHVLTPILDGVDTTCEVWLSDAGLTQGRRGALRYRYNDELLFGVIELPETGPLLTSATPLQQTTESAYWQILTLLADLNYPFMYRFWNYMADINGVSHGLERYQQFNLGRQDAFLACGCEVTGELPAASTLGQAHGSLTIAFLAGRTPALAIENPRQVSAYDYPQEYGPRSPTFSRASLLRLPQEEVLFISGTASIVGHETLHQADVVAQTQETLANLQAVITEANRRLGEAKFDLANIFYRVYVRHAADAALIRNEMNRIIGSQINSTIKAIFLQADICRQDLLLEIETTMGQNICTEIGRWVDCAPAHRENDLLHV